MKKILSIVAIAALVLTSCGKEDTTAFDVNGISTKATVSGTIYYLADKDGAATRPYSTVADETIYVQVEDRNGVIKTFTTKTDSDGKYSFTVPTADNYATNVTFYLNFAANQKQTDGKQREGVFKGDSYVGNLEPNKEYVKNFNITDFEIKYYNPNPAN